MDVCCECWVSSGRGVCVELITHPKESYQLWCVIVCDLETIRMRNPWPALGCSITRGKKFNYKYNFLKLIFLACSVMLSNCVAICSWCHRDNLWPRWCHHTHWSDWWGLVAGTWSGWDIRALSCQLRGTSQLGSGLQKTLKDFICVCSISFITLKCLCILQHWFVICILIIMHSIFNLSLFWHKYV